MSFSWGNVYITEKNVGSDRCASAWFISRFVDDKAEFVFIDQGDEPPEGVTFDFFGADYFHKGSDCTFTTLIKSHDFAKIKALQKINENINDVFSWRWSAKSFPTKLQSHIANLRELTANDNEVYQVVFPTFDLLYSKYGGELEKMLPGQQAKVSQTLLEINRQAQDSDEVSDALGQEVSDFQKIVLQIPENS